MKIGNLDINSFKVGGADCSIYLGDVKMYPLAPSQEPCFAVVDDIGLYGDTDYIDVYNKDDSKWYKLNNEDSYEEYGIYETGDSLSDFTYYDGKLVAIGEDEYQYNDNDWELVGEYITGGGETTYEITSGDDYRYQGELFSTTFKIPIQDVQGVWGGITIGAAAGGFLNINFNGLSPEQSGYEIRIGQNAYTGIVTSDTDYLYFSMDNDEVRSIIIDSIPYFNSGTIHIIDSGDEVSYDIDSNSSSDYERYAMLTNFKIPYEDVQMGGDINFRIEDMANNKVISINIDELTQEYTYGDSYGGNTYTGTVTNDIEYYYFEPPVEAPSAITMSRITVNGGDAHIIFGGGSNIISVEYPVKQAPENNVSFDTMEDALEYECPWVGMTAVIDSVPYIFSDSFEWITKFDYVVVAGQFICSNGDKYEKLEQKIRNTDGTWSSQSPAVYRQGALIEADSPDCLVCSVNFCGENSTGGTITIDNGTSTLPRNAASGAVNGEVGSATQTIGAYCFAGSGLTSLTIANTVTTIEHEAFNGTYGLTTLTIPASVTQIDFWAFTRCSGLTEVIFEGTTPPTFTNQHSGVFHDYCPPVIYVPDESVEAYRAISGSVWTNQTWSTNIIQPISLR